MYVKHKFDADFFMYEVRSENCVNHMTSVAHSSLSEVNSYK